MTSRTISPTPAFAVTALRRTLPGWLLLAAAALSVTFVLVPQLDLAASGLFALGAGGFPLQHAAWLGLINGSVLKISRAASAVLPGLALLAWMVPHASAFGRQRRTLLFIFVALALGPGLLVNSVLKDASGRARPVQIEQFGGARHFTPAFLLADECDRNCSFVSGHVAAATMPVAGYFVAVTRRRRRQWLVAGVVLGLAVGLARLAVGAHFLSDVVLAMFLTWAVCALVAGLVLRPQHASDAPMPMEASL
jgi:lipid A 4'-phosphatase